ncbi:NUDIX domain-containing protein [Bacteroidota bacterium]
MSNFYSHGKKHLIAVDCIIFGFDDEGLKLLLFNRKVDPEKGRWSLLGGFINNNESVDDAALRVLSEITGLSNIYLEQLYTYGEVERDTGARVISIAYYALIKSNEYSEKLNHHHDAKWFSIDNVPDLIFDHNIMVEKALARLQRKSKIQPIGFELLPKKFTIPQLQKLYEAIFQKKFDKRNFRKKIISLKTLKKYEEKDKLNSKKGAYLYSFDKTKYKKLLEKGYHFEI